ncbi:MAG TPA: hypothetical protein VGH57_16825 [Amycolatopsis sp.]|jgi:hypothetical protein
MHGWTVPAKSIDAVTLSSGVTLQQGTAINLDEVMTEHACQAILTTTAMSDQAGVHLEGSLDGTNWYTLAVASVPPGGATGAGTVTALISATGTAALFVRATVPGGGVAGTPTLATVHTSA